jgi:hypothetical protein
MINFKKKTETTVTETVKPAKPAPAQTPAQTPAESSENRFESIRKTATEKHIKADTSGTRRRAKQTAEDNRLI